MTFTMTGLPATLQRSIQQTVPVSGIINDGSALPREAVAVINGSTIAFSTDSSGSTQTL